MTFARRVAPVALALLTASVAAAPAATISVVNGVEVIDGGGSFASAPRAHRNGAQRRNKAVASAASTGLEAAAGPRSVLADALVRSALAYVGTPYVWGGASPRGFDCSGYTQFVFRSVGIEIPRTADLQFAAGRPIAGYPAPGDLVFFQTYDWGASHVGIYLGNGWFVQEIRPGVHLSNFNSAYFRSRYLGARRFLPA